ncbi:MAG: hypothetical protein HQL32_15375, partial [Planctomycetes bacterium]|nr:hypothetical protein [Planctomycetota bacterium]
TLQSASKVNCTVNLGSITTAMNLYLSDNNEYYTPANFNTGEYLHGSWDDLLGQGYDGRNLSDGDVGRPGLSIGWGIYECSQQVDEYAQRNRRLRSYSMNCNQEGSSDGGISSLWGETKSVSSDKIPNPSETIILLENHGSLGAGYDGAGVYHYNDQMNSLNKNPDMYHQMQFSYLFADSHVELLLPLETCDPTIGDWWSGKYWTRNPDD